jgi:hypothetical protein
VDRSDVAARRECDLGLASGRRSSAGASNLLLIVFRDDVVARPASAASAAASSRIERCVATSGEGRGSVLQFHAVSRAGVGAFIRDLVKSFYRAGGERSFRAEERRDAVAHADPLAAAPEPPPPVMRPRRSGGRLIDLERRAKFARFDAI